MAMPPRAAVPRAPLPNTEREPVSAQVSPPSLTLPLAAAPAPQVSMPSGERQAPPPAAAAPVPDALPIVTSDTFGQVHIGLEGDSTDLRVSLAVSAGAPGLLAADAPRLAADLAANGIRLHSLDVGSLAGGAGGSLEGGAPGRGGQQRHAGQPGQTAPAAAFAAPPPPSRPAAADRYA
jgi:hypothetical protein